MSSSTAADDTGNFPPFPIDHLVVRCVDAHVAISARLDGELAGRDAGALDEHLGGCPQCRGFAERAVVLHRRVRVAAAPTAPDRTQAILAALDADRASLPLAERIHILRVLLAVIATVQLAMALPAVVLGDDLGLPTHAARHLGSFSLALAVGFFWMAWAPERSAGLVPVATVLAACVLVTSLADVVAGRAGAASEVAHAPEIAGLTAAWLLERARSGEPGRRGGRLAILR